MRLSGQFDGWDVERLVKDLIHHLDEADCGIYVTYCDRILGNGNECVR